MNEAQPYSQPHQGVTAVRNTNPFILAQGKGPQGEALHGQPLIMGTKLEATGNRNCSLLQKPNFLLWLSEALWSPCICLWAFFVSASLTCDHLSFHSWFIVGDSRAYHQLIRYCVFWSKF